VRVLRPGSITLSQLRRVVGEVIDAGPQAPRVPGDQRAHYAPATPLSIVPVDDIEELAALLSSGGQRVAVLAQRPPLGTYQSVTWIDAGPRVEAYAHDLYAHLRTLDRAGCSRILVQAVPSEEPWDAVRDRLVRAAAASADHAGEHDDSIAVGILP
jgi:L-threonylcarbamoyladenylate synthase